MSNSAVLTYTTVRGSSAVWDELLRTRPERLWAPPSILRNRYRDSFFPGGTATGADCDYPPPSSSETKERADRVPSWHVMGRTLLVRCRTSQQPRYTDARRSHSVLTRV